MFELLERVKVIVIACGFGWVFLGFVGVPVFAQEGQVEHEVSGLRVESIQLLPKPLPDIKVGDVVVEWSAKELPADRLPWVEKPTEALESPWDWEALERGAETYREIELVVVRDGKRNIIGFEVGTLRMSVAPNFRDENSRRLYVEGSVGNEVEPWSELTTELLRQGDPANASWLRLLAADKLTQNGRFDEADVYYQELAVDKQDSSIPPLALEHWSWSFEQRGQLEPAIEKTRRQLESWKAYRPKTRLPLLQTQEQLAFLELEAGKLESARKQLSRSKRDRSWLNFIYKRFEKPNADQLFYFHNLAVMDARAGRFQEAEKRLEELADHDRFELLTDLNPTYYSNLGAIRAWSGDFDSAALDYNEAFERLERQQPGTSEYAEVMRQLGVIELERGDIPQGRDLIEQALRIQEEVAPNSTYRARALSSAALIEERQGDSERALELARQAWSLQQEIAPGGQDAAAISYQLGLAEIEAKELDAGRDAFLRSIEINETPGAVPTLQYASFKQLSNLESTLGNEEESRRWNRQADRAAKAGKIDTEKLETRLDSLQHLQATVVVTEGSRNTPQKRAIKKGAYWNSWIVEKGREDRVLEHIEVSERDKNPRNYLLRMELSNLPYREWLDLDSGVYSAVTDPQLAEAILDEVDREGSELDVTAIVFPMGPELEILGIGLPGEKFDELEMSRTVTINLERLARGTVGHDQAGASKAGKKSLADLVGLRAGSIDIWIRGVRAGCGAVALAITHLGRVRFLDHVIRLIPVAENGEPPSQCSHSALEGQNFAAGLKTLLAHEGAPKVDAALGVIESKVGSQTKVAAFLIEPELAPIYWYPRRPPTKIMGPGQDDLPRKILYDREFKSNCSCENPYAYTEAAGVLRSAIFDSDDMSSAQAGMERLSKLAKQGAAIVVRMIDSSREPFFLPVRMLSHADGLKSWENLDFIFPLFDEDYSSEPDCIDGWNFVAPESIGEQPVPQVAKAEGGLGWLHVVDPEFEKMVDFFSIEGEATSNRPRERGEGLILLAHHNEGRLWFSNAPKPLNEEKFNADDIRKKFGKGGFAFFGSCETASPGRDDLRLLKNLDQLGVDVAVASPFRMEARFGAALAVGFARAVEGLRMDPRPATIKEVFQEAVSQAGQVLLEERVDYPDSSLDTSEVPEEVLMVEAMEKELILLGNHSIKICTGEN